MIRRIVAPLVVSALVAFACAHPRPSVTPSVTDGYVDINGVRLHYLTAGQGPLILFLHGFPEFSYAWRDQLAEFGRDHHAVAVDMRGYNLSSKPQAVGEYQIAKLIADVGGLADHFGARSFVVVAHDWGGAVAWSFAIAHPERLDKLVIINSPHPALFARELARNPAQRQASQYMLAFRAPMAEATYSANGFAALRALVSDLFTASHFTRADSAAYIAAWSQVGALTGGFNYYRMSPIFPPAPGTSPTLSAPLPSAQTRVLVPTLVIWGERDRYLVPENLVGLDQYVPNLVVKRMPNASHWVVHEQPAEINALIREFLR
jgi:pimeloyl-ACP methyl ester carboxylesterase